MAGGLGNLWLIKSPMFDKPSQKKAINQDIWLHYRKHCPLNIAGSARKENSRGVYEFLARQPVEKLCTLKQEILPNSKTGPNCVMTLCKS